MSRRLVVATLNAAKGRELAKALARLPFEVVLLGDLPGASLPPEGERSYVGNALAKARSAALLAGAVALADDSGLEIDALGGLPGVRSARFGGEHLTDAERCALVLARMRGVAPGRRTARFRCVIALADPTGREDTAEGTVEGEIAEAARGTSPRILIARRLPRVRLACG
ncbi:MAG: non-canonical purine NTP pyrophosphatase [Candidatus Rokuibacteriota bacterium]|nr:MAG: non-canonical purine NTP pyrophosphatase [Candidatus Rokubacteria bacterium]